MPRARCSGGNISAAAARESRTMPLAAPSAMKPGTTSSQVSAAQPAAVSTPPRMPKTKPTRMTGMRPNRSIARPPGPALRALEARKIAGPRPRMPSTPVTSTSVTVATATASWNIPDMHSSPAASRNAFRLTG